MEFRAGRIIFAAIAVEVLAVLALVSIVALFGPSGADAARLYAERLGVWVGPIAGFVLCVLGGWWVAKGLRVDHVLNGLILGVVAAGIDIAILVSSGAAFQPILAVSNIGRVIAGSIGGWLARRRLPT